MSDRTPAYSTTPSCDRYSTVVVGAGPAGIMAALHAAARGPVLLCDKSALPRTKSCGGMLHAQSLAVLGEYGQIPETIVVEPRTVHFRYHDWDRGIRKLTELAFLNVDRAGFDAWLLGLLRPDVEIVAQAAVHTVSQTPESVTVGLKLGNDTVRTVKADLVVGADGARSQVRRLLGSESSASYVTLQDFVTLEGPLEPVFDCIYMRQVGDEFGYAYVVPKGSHALVGSVFYPKTRRPWEKHDAVLARLRERLPALGRSVGREASAALYLRSRDDVVCGSGRVLLAGEAGGFMSPTSGEGISYALASGRAAGLASAGPAEEALDRYLALTEPLRRDIARRLRWLPLMESRAGKYLAGFVPEPIVSRVTMGL